MPISAALTNACWHLAGVPGLPAVRCSDTAACCLSSGTFLTAVSLRTPILALRIWNHRPAAMQNFLEDMLDTLDDLGLQVPSQTLQIPIIWHDPRYYPGETLVNAMHAGANFFRAKPTIIFVCLLEKGMAASPRCLRAESFLC